MNKTTINRAIKHTGLEVQHKRGGGYSYFTALDDGEQAGESVPVCYLHSLPLARWVEEAEAAKLALDEARSDRAEYRAQNPEGFKLRLASR